MTCPERRRRVPINQAAHSGKIRLRARLERIQQIDDGVKSLIARDKIARFVGERALGQRRDVAAKHQQGHVRVGVLDRSCERRGAGHVLRRCRRLMTVDDDGDEDRRQGVDAIRGLLGRQLVGLGIDNLDREPLVRARTWQ